MPERQANFMVLCAVAAFGLAASLAAVFAASTWSGSSEAAAGGQIDPLQMMMNSKDLPASHHDDYSLVFN